MQLDDDLKESLNKIISTLLPHENYDGTFYNTILVETFKLIHLDELSMEYYIMFHILSEVGKIKLPFQNAVLTRASFQDIVGNFILNEVNSKKIGLLEYLKLEGESVDLMNIENKERAMNILYTLCLRLFDKAFELKIPSQEYPPLLLALRENVLSTLAYDCLEKQSMVLRDGINLGRHFLFGPNDWLELIKHESSNIASRLKSDTSETSILLDSSSKGRELIDSMQNQGTTISHYGLPPIDDETPIMRNRLVIFAGQPNIGKTAIMLSLAIRIILDGGKVVILTGESTPGKIYIQLLSAYIKVKYNINIPPRMISNLDKCSDEVVRLVNLYQSEFSSLGQLLIQEQFSYDTFYEQAVSLRDTFAYDVLFVDHTLSMANLKDPYQCLEQLAFQSRMLKNDYPVYVCLLSHLSTETQRELKEGKNLEAPCTKHNGTLESEADDVFILTANPELKKQKKIGIINKKRRDAMLIHDTMIARVDFQFKQLQYYEEDQIGNATQYMDSEKAAENLAAFYGISDYEDEEDEEDGGDIYG